MKVHVHFYAQLRDVAGTSQLDVDLAGDAKVGDLLERIYELRSALRAHDKSVLVGAGLEFVDRDYVLKESEEIAIMPPVQGG